MLIGDGWAFIHTPKCGGTTLRAHLKGREVSEWLPMQGRHTVDHPFHWLARERPDGWVFTVQRSPESWLRSYWGHRMRHGWRDGMFLDQFRDDDLNEFMLRVARNATGYITDMFDAYAKAYGGVEVIDISKLSYVLKLAKGKDAPAAHKNKGKALPVPRLMTLEMVEGRL